MSNDKKNQPSPNTNTGNRTLTEDRKINTNSDYSESNSRSGGFVQNTMPAPKNPNNGNNGNGNNNGN